MRAPLLVALLSLTAAAQSAPRFLRFTSRMEPGRNTRGLLANNLAFFEAFPSSGAGTSGACSTTPPTGAKGEALTFTRASNGTCTKTATGGLATTGIADGDLVVLSSNQPRVEYDSGGVLGLLVEASRTNSLLRSQEIDNAAWSSSTGAGAVTVTADQAIAPDGTLTADRLQVSACPTAGAYSARLQAMALVSTRTWSVYVRGNGTSGNIGMIVGGGATYSGVVCPYVSTSWTRCSVSVNAVAGDAWIGCVNATVASPNPGNTGAADVFVWGGQVEAGAYATSYIPTGAGTATRATEGTPSFTLPSAIGPSFCAAASSVWPSASVGAVTSLQLGTAAPDLARIGRNTNAAASFLINATTTTPAVSAMGTAQQCGALSDASGTRSAWWNASGVSAPAASMTGTFTAVSIGTLDGIVSRVQVDHVSSRCSP